MGNSISPTCNTYLVHPHKHIMPLPSGNVEHRGNDSKPNDARTLPSNPKPSPSPGGVPAPHFRKEEIETFRRASAEQQRPP